MVWFDGVKRFSARYEVIDTSHVIVRSISYNLSGSTDVVDYARRSAARVVGSVLTGGGPIGAVSEGERWRLMQGDSSLLLAREDHKGWPEWAR